MEGAGGAAEINLYSRDIANILLAKKLQLPIILVADIERGGVFASIYGTVELLLPVISAGWCGELLLTNSGETLIFFCQVPG